MKFNKVYIEITNRCNLNCSFCKQSNNKKRGMSVKEFKHVISEVKKVTKNIYLHVKGEPLLHPHLDELLQICDDNEMRVNITTNGTLINHQKEIILKHDCVKKINFSLHSENEYPDYLMNIFNCVNELSKKMTIVYRLWTLNDHTLDEKSSYIVLAIQKYYQLNEEKVELIHRRQNAKVTDQIYVDKDNEFVWPSLKNEILNEDGYCYALKTHVAILVNGTVVPCCLDGEGIIQLGNIYEQSIETINESERFTRLKKSFQDRKPCEQLCKRCGFKIRLKK